MTCGVSNINPANSHSVLGCFTESLNQSLFFSGLVGPRGYPSVTVEVDNVPLAARAFPNQQQHTFYWFLLQSIPFHNFLDFCASNENSTQCFFIELLSRSKLFYRRIFQVKRWSSANAMPHSLNTAQSLKAWTLSIKFNEWMDGWMDGMAILNSSTHKIWTF